jgi:hypothetical protein
MYSSIMDEGAPTTMSRYGPKAHCWWEKKSARKTLAK